MQDLYKQISAAIFDSLQNDEAAVTTLSGEDTLYLRYNGGKIRQNTQVHQYEMSLRYRKENKTMSLSWSFENNKELAIKTALESLNWLRKECALIPDSDHLTPIENLGHSENNFKGQLPSDLQAIEDIAAAAESHDFCGFAALGSQTYANQNSKGQSHWFSKESFFVDFSMYNGDRAVKGMYSDSSWNSSLLKEKIQEAANQLALMNRPTVKVKPGRYRVFLEPGAVNEVMGFLSWYAFGQKAFQTGSGFFTDLGRGQKTLNPLMTIRENFNLGLSAPFNEVGETSPEFVTLVENGHWKQWLTSTRSAMEFKVPSNFASENEGPRSLEILPGQLKHKDILKELGTGLYLANLHYVNSSDSKSARLTGMTRYACFWVENGEIVGPIENLRFDESLYEAWGPKLVALTTEAEVIPNTLTYGERPLGGNKLPGMLINDFSFTL